MCDTESYDDWVDLDFGMELSSEISSDHSTDIMVDGDTIIVKSHNLTVSDELISDELRKTKLIETPESEIAINNTLSENIEDKVELNTTKDEVTKEEILDEINNESSVSSDVSTEDETISLTESFDNLKNSCKVFFITLGKEIRDSFAAMRIERFFACSAKSSV